MVRNLERQRLLQALTKVARNYGLQGVRDDVGRKKATEMMTAIRGWKKRTESVQERHKKTHWVLYASVSHVLAQVALSDETSFKRCGEKS